MDRKKSEHQHEHEHISPPKIAPLPCCKFVEVCLPDEHCPIVSQPLHDSRGVGRHKVSQHARRAPVRTPAVQKLSLTATGKPSSALGRPDSNKPQLHNTVKTRCCVVFSQFLSYESVAFFLLHFLPHFIVNVMYVHHILQWIELIGSNDGRNNT